MHDCEWREAVKNVIIKEGDTLEVEGVGVIIKISEVEELALSVLRQGQVLEGLLCMLELVLLAPERT